ncbi:hypothetical protein BGV40_15280 [Methanosarcina sp. Ant1]|nr:hypothetical protein BGV40_15280 [Methanosarcina sp. Ant1]
MTSIYNLPSGWKLKPFTECIEKSVSSNKLKIPQADFKRGGLYPIVDQSIDFIAGYTNNSSKVYKDNLPVIIFGDHTRIFKFIDFPFAFGADGTKLLLPKKEIFDPKYFYFFLTGLTIENQGYSRHYKILKEKQIVIPPINVQKKIVAILEKAEKLKEWRKEADKLANEFLESTFLEMFGDPVKNPKNWSIEKIQYLISSIEAGWSANGESRSRKENEYAVLKVSAVTQGFFLPEECKVINNDIELKKVVTPEKGDVLFSRANTLELVGASCLIREDYPYLLLPDKLWKIEVNKEKIYPEYLKFVLSHPTIRSEISKVSTGTSGSMYNISMSKLKLIGITVPPIEIQKNFSIIVETVEKAKEFQKQSSIEINILFNAFMQKGFRGELIC